MKTLLYGEVGQVAPNSRIGVHVYSDEEGLHFRLTEYYQTHRATKPVVMANAGDLPWAAIKEAMPK